jgi:uncharacterized protein
VGKLLSWVAIAFAVYVAYKVVLALQRKAQLRKPSPPDATSGSNKFQREEAGQLTALIACAHCGLQLPQDEAISAQDVSFCSEAHARLGIRKTGDT